MKRPRRNDTAAYKGKMALAALKGDKTLAEPLKIEVPAGEAERCLPLGRCGEHDDNASPEPLAKLDVPHGWEGPTMEGCPPPGRSLWVTFACRGFKWR